MREIIEALLGAVASLVHPRIWLLMIWPMGVSLVLWIILALVFGHQVFDWAQASLAATELYRSMAQTWPLSLIATMLVWLALALAFIPLVLGTASLIVSIVSMPVIIRHVAQDRFPDLERCHGGGVAGSLWNALSTLALVAALALASLPLWLMPFLWPVIPVLLFAFFDQRLFRYDALAEHASSAELRELIRAHRGQWLGLGVLLALIGHLPIVGFFVPVLSGLAFTHFGLARLRALRLALPPQATYEGSSIR
jgi:hypothetical protein